MFGLKLRKTPWKSAVILGEYDSDYDRYQIQSGVTEDDYIAYPEETLQEGAPTTQDITQVVPEDPSAGGDGSMDGGTVDGGSADDGTAMDPGMAVPYTEEEIVEEEVPSQTDSEDGEGAVSDSLEGSPMEGLAR